MRRVILIFILFMVFPHGAYSSEDEDRRHVTYSRQKYFLKSEHFSNEIDTDRLWWDARIQATENIHFFFYPILTRNLDNEEAVTLRTIRSYTAINIENLYVGIGKQPIIWGVGQGRNPTNYFMNIQPLDKQKSQEVALEGILSYLVEYSSQGSTLEMVIADDKTHASAIRAKTFLFDTDMSLSFFRKDGASRMGGDFETDIKGEFLLYSEASAKDQDNWDGLIGVKRTLTSFNKSNIYLEYYYDGRLKKKEINGGIYLQPTEEVSVLSSVSHDINQNVSLWMTRLGYAWEEFEFVVTPLFKVKHGEKDIESFPQERIITAQVIAHFF